MGTPLLSLISNALIEAEWLSQGETPQAEDAQFTLGKLNDLLDEWAAQDRYVYSNEFNLYTLVPGLAPHTIGPDNATFKVPQRPVRLVSAAIVLSNGDQTTTDIPIAVQDDQWWANVRIKDLQSQIPTAVYYSESFPNGSLFFWPVPDVNYQTRLETWGLIGQFANVQQTLNLPPAYRKALTLTVAEELAGPRSGDPKLAKAAADARSAIWSNNAQSPTINTAQPGMSPAGERRTNFNFLDGSPW